MKASSQVKSSSSQVKSSQVKLSITSVRRRTRPSSHPAFMDLSLSFERA